MNPTWEAIGRALADDVGDLLDLPFLATALLRLFTAAVLGSILGYEREVHHKSAGLRTHMLVAVGAALFLIAPQRIGLGEGDLGRVIQGITAGVGFIGGGAILKLSAQGQVRGLTTAASIWLTAAVGVAAGCGRLGVALMATLLGIVVLLVLGRYEQKLMPAPPETAEAQTAGPQTAEQPEGWAQRIVVRSGS